MSSEKLEIGTVGKTDLVRAARKKLKDFDLTHDHMADAYDAFMEAVREAVLNGETVLFQGIGRLIPIVRPAGEARNPTTGKKVKVDARLAVKFAVNTNLKLACREVDIKSLGNSGDSKPADKARPKVDDKPSRGARAEAPATRPSRRAR